MAKDMMYQAMKDIAKKKGIKLSAEHDLYKMDSPYFLNAFYSDIEDKKEKKMCVNLTYEAKYCYFDDLKLYIVEPDSTVKLTDKVRANSVIRFRSVIHEEAMEFDCGGAEETYTEIAEKTVEHMEKWYRDFFDEVKNSYGDLENYFLSKKDSFLMQAAFIYLHQEKYDLAEECIQKLPPKLYSVRSITPKTEEQKLRLTASNAANFGSSYHRDDMDCIIDYVAAKKRGLEWTAERACYGLLKEEREN